MTNAVSIAQIGSNNTTFRNRIINGAMVIDQRNNGASVTATTANEYTLDRWQQKSSVSSKFTVQQVSTGGTLPAFPNTLKVVSSSAYSSGSSDYFFLSQNIEGFNFADLGWGTSSAKTITLSFWTYSSLTGTFGGALRNANADYSYPFTYTISSANTWEQKSVTIAGPTSGTWVGATNGTGVTVCLNLGTGTTYSGTAGAWAASNYVNATGSVAVTGTSGATWYLTGVQLEAGSAASPFENRSYGLELSLCQRYYEVLTSTGAGIILGSGVLSGTSAWAFWYYKQTKRAIPTVALGSGTGAGWSHSTPGIYPEIDNCSLNTASSYFYNTCSSGIAMYASAEL